MWQCRETLHLIFLQFIPVPHIVHSWMPCSKWVLMTLGLSPRWLAHHVLSFSSRKPWEEEEPPFLAAHPLLFFTPFSGEESWSRCLPLILTLAWPLNLFSAVRLFHTYFCPCLTKLLSPPGQHPFWNPFLYSLNIQLWTCWMSSWCSESEMREAQSSWAGLLRWGPSSTEPAGSSQEWLGNGWLLSSHCILEGVGKGSWKGDSKKQGGRSRAQSFHGPVSFPSYRTNLFFAAWAHVLISLIPTLRIVLPFSWAYCEN